MTHYRFCCSFSRRKGNRPCPVSYRVLQFNTVPEVVVEAVAGLDHVHEKDPDYLPATPETFRWSQDMTDIVYQGIVTGMATTDIHKRLLHSGLLSDGKFPSKIQMNNKINHVSRLFGLKQKTENPAAKTFQGRSRGRPRNPKNRVVPFVSTK